MYSCGWDMEDAQVNTGWSFRINGIFPRVILWLAISIVVDLPGLYSVSGSGWNSASILRQSLGEISSTAFLGVLFFLGAGLFLSSRFVRNYERIQQLVRPFIVFLLLTALYLVFRSIIIFNTFTQFGEVGAEINLAFVNGALLAVPLVSFIFCSLAAGVAIIIDDWRITTVAGCSLFLVVNLFLGMPHADAFHPEMSLFGPSHFYRAMILVFSGLYAIIPLSIQSWGGVTSIYSMIVPTLVYIILTLISVWTIKNYGTENLQRRHLLNKSDTIHVTEQEQMDETKLGNRLKARRKAVLICFLIFGLLIPIGGYSYTSMRSYDVTTVVYEAILRPTNGTLFYGEFTTEVPTPDVSRWIGFPLTILDWGDCPSPIQFEYAFGDGSIYDFLALNEQERWRPSRSENLENDQMVYLQSRSSGLDELAGVHYWAIRFYSDEWTSELGSLRVRISIVLRDMRLL